MTICTLLNIKPEDVKNPNAKMNRPFLQFLPDRKEAVELILRLYCVKKDHVLDVPTKED